jgi:hypothetical protein
MVGWDKNTAINAYNPFLGMWIAVSTGRRPVLLFYTQLADPAPGRRQLPVSRRGVLPDHINVTVIAFQLEIAVIRPVPGLHHFLDKHFALIDIQDTRRFLAPMAGVALDSKHEATNLLDLGAACSGGTCR